MKSILFACLAAASLTLPGCAAVQRPVAAATTASLVLKAAEALYVAQIVYQNAAEAMLVAIENGLIAPSSAGDIRAINTKAYDALVKARGAVDAADRLRNAQSAIGFANELLALAKGVVK